MITVSTKINKPVSLIWDCFTKPEHLIHWYYASDEWHCPDAKIDLVENGNFSLRMASKDGKYSFNFTGTYLKLIKNQLLEYKISDERHVIIKLTE